MTLKILIAEDSATNRLLFSMILQRLGYAVALAANGEEAAVLFSNERYDLVFLDLNMPVLNGIETARRIMKVNARHTPVYAISGFPPEEMERQFPEVGIRRCLIKPLDRAKLAEVLAECGLGRLETAGPDIADTTRLPDKVLDTYARELRARGQACLQKLRGSTRADLAREAHTIRGLAQMLHSAALEGAAAKVEECHDGPKILSPLVEDLAAACARVAQALEIKLESKSH